jgi:7-carboxy-7-deazaguanine synthase
MIRIAEIFHSLQGEGMLVGVPSVFIRTSGCNLRCVWCDTPYASWEPEGEALAVEEIAERAGSYGASHVVVTGGEPMMFPEIVSLTANLRRFFAHITIETAGTVHQPVTCDLMSISPKLSNSTPWGREEGRWAAQHERLRIQADVLRRLMKDFEYQLKFVVQSTDDMQEILDILDQTGASRERVLLMPEATDRESLHERSLWLAELCRQYHFRFSPRLHIELWGGKRGV